MKERSMASDIPKAKKTILLGHDGADPLLVKRFMDEGKMPNLKKVMERGTTTTDLAMMGVHPTITPPNWASLATGANPGTHGITCFWNHTTGKDLLTLSYGFNSRLSKAEFIWDSAAAAGKKSILFNYPTAWPPTRKENLMVIDGSMVVVNTRAMIDHETVYYGEEGNFPIEETPHHMDTSGVDCMIDEEVDEKDFELSEGEAVATTALEGFIIKALEDRKTAGMVALRYDRVKTPIKEAGGWKNDVAKAREVVLPINGGLERRFGLILTGNGEKYNKLRIYVKKQDEKPIGEVRTGEWSEWIYDHFRVSGETKPVAYKVKLLKLDEDGSRMELYYSCALDLTNTMWMYPHQLCSELYEKVGPIMHHSYCGDHEVMAEAYEQMYDWYGRALKYLMTGYEWDLLYIHVHALDYANHIYQNAILEEHNPEYQRHMEYLYRYYKMTDDLTGELLEAMDDKTLLFIVSDHGGRSREVGCESPLIGDPHSVAGKLMEDLGYMVVDRDKDPPEIIWEKTKAISQRSGYIYVNLKGREPHGSVDPEEYDELVEKIIDDLLCMRDPHNGRRPVALALRREDMPVLGLYGDHVGDIYFTFNPSWTRVHGTQLTTSTYKGTSVGCLFMAAGPGIRKGAVIERPVSVIDIVPTICHLTDIPVPKDVEGGIIYQALEG
jgi:predicted AlkP superfamily phosphohydrolase/phosphomutase